MMGSADEAGGMNRRGVLAMGGVAAAATLASCASAAETAGGSSAVAPKSVDASTPERKWAHQHLRGMANLFFPSFKADLQTVDEEGVRRDVNAAVAQGFCGTMPMVNWTRPGDPRWDVYHRAVFDEAKGKLPVHGVASMEDVDADVALIRKLEAMGADMLLLAPYHAADISAEDLTAAYKRRIEATGLPVILYAATGAKRNFPHLGPGGQPLDVFDRLADMPNVVAMKVSQPITLTSTMQICDAVADRLLVAPVNLDFVPALARSYPIQWSGQWNAEAVQTPDNQLGNKLLAACASGDSARIDAAAREIQAVHDAFYNLQASVIRSGAHPVQHNKYYSWLGGGNGGILPDDTHAPPGAVPVLDAAARTKMRAAFAASGLVPTDAPEEQFVVGRAAWDRGVRVSDLAGLPSYRG
jgi:hypothetical protein